MKETKYLEFLAASYDDELICIDGWGLDEEEPETLEGN